MYPEDEDNEFSRADLLNFLGEFISQNRNAETLYRNHLCGVIVSRIFDEFGPEGLCELMMQIDIKAGWISDIIFESSDFNNAMFKRHGIYDEKIVNKARSTDSLNELNQKTITSQNISNSTTRSWTLVLSPATTLLTTAT